VEFIKKDTRFFFPRTDCPGFSGDNPIEWVRKCNSYFVMHQVPTMYKTHLATIQFHGLASEWYDGYLIDHEPPDWENLVILVQRHFTKPNSKNTLEEWKSMH
jgi:hypothetical protein